MVHCTTKLLSYLLIIVFLGSNVVHSDYDNEYENEFLENSHNVMSIPMNDWWPMYHHDSGNTGYSTSYGPNTNDVLWIFNANGTINSPSIYNEKIFITTQKDNSPISLNSFLYCLDEDANEIWSYKSIDNLISTPAIYNGYVYIVSENGNIHCIHEQNGNQIWKVESNDQFISSPIVSDGKIILGSREGNVFCFDANAGDELWNTQIGVDMQCTPAVVDGRVFVSNFCLDISNGQKLWNSELGLSLLSTPAVYDNKVYMGCIDELFYCHNASTGETIWDFYTGSMRWQSSPAVAYDKIYVGTGFGFVYCIDAENGDGLWSAKMGNPSLYSPAVCDDKVYIGSVDGVMYCLDAHTGDEIWKYRTSKPFSYSPAIADGRVYIGSGNRLYCFSSDQHLIPNLYSEGNLHWSDIKPGSQIKNNIIVQNVGQPNSKLDWRIDSYPEWGNWTFNPDGGDELEPEDGAIIVEITIDIPNDQQASFSGQVKIVNIENDDDFEILEVTVSTVKNKEIQHPFIRFIKHHSPLLEILQYAFGLKFQF